MDAHDLLSKPAGVDSLVLYKVALVLLVILSLIGAEFDARARYVVVGAMCLSLLIGVVIDLRETMTRKAAHKRMMEQG